MLCPRCQTQNRPGAQFCRQCGARLESVCPKCNAPVEPGSRFCDACGADLTAGAGTAPAPATPTAPPPAQFGPPGAYTPKHLAEKILTSRSALEGERKQVTVLFVDIVESSRLAEQLDPEILHQVMDQVLRLMAEAVHRYEGTVNQFLGDGVMALFGAPVALEDHAYRAVQAALAIRETVSGHSEALKREHGVEITLRLGLNSGLVVVGKIGDDLRMDYTAIGDTTHLAARMQTLAEPGTILITDATRRLVEGYIRSEALGPVQVKGRGEPVPVFKVTGRRRPTSRFEVHADLGLTELIGRGRELAILQDRFARAKAGRGHVVGIVGEPGVGKSRLLYEFRKSPEAERVIWLEGHCVAYGQTTPYLPVLEILRTNFHIEDGDNPPQIDEKLRQGVRQLDPNLEPILPSLRELFGVSGADPALAHLDPKDTRQKIFEAVRALTVAGSQHRPHVLIIEDLHWIDKTSEDYLAFLAESLTAVPALLLTTHRPGYSVRWADKTYYSQIALDLLTDREVEAMVGSLLGARHVPAGLVRRVQEKAEGNPLFVEEITTSLREGGLVRQSNGGVVWASDAVVEFPGTVQDIIRARLDRLDDPVKRTVQTAAVIGRQFGLNLLRRVSERSQAVQQDVESLKRLELVHETRFFPELEYIFKHAVIQDVAYQSLLGQRRKELHGAIARAIEDLSADRLENQAPILAYHYARSAHGDQAIKYAFLAGDRAARLYAHTEATSYYEQALVTARALPLTQETQRAEIDASVKLATVAATHQDIERDQGNLERARALSECLPDQPRLAQVLYWLGRVQYVLGNPAAAIAYAEQGLGIAERLGDEALAAPPVNLIGRASYQQGDFRKTAQMLRRSAEQMRQLGNKSDEATTAAFAGLACAMIGEAEAAHALGDEGVRLAEHLQNPFTRAGAHFLRGAIRSTLGEWDGAIQDLEEAKRLAESTGDLFRIHIVKCWEGRTYALAGNPARGRVPLEEGLALGEQIGTQFDLARHKAWLAACLLALGEEEAVERLCREAIEVAESAGDKLGMGFAQQTLAEALSCLDPADREGSARAMHHAIRVQQEIGVRPDLARTYVGQARLLHAGGESERARAVLMESIRIFQDIGMTSELHRAEQVLREL